MEEKKDLRFYEEPLFTWFFLVIFPPIGIVLLWGIKHYSTMVRVFLSILFTLFFLNLLGLHEGLLRATLFTLFLAFLEYTRQKIEHAVKQAKAQYKELKESEDINLIFDNYISMYHKELDDLHGIVGLEYILEKKFPFKRIYGFQVNDYYYIKAIYQSFEIELDKFNEDKMTEYFEKKFIMLAELMEDQTKFQGKRHASYVTYMLLKEKMMEFNGNEFKKKYGEYFKHCINFNDFVKQFILLKNINTEENSKDVLHFTYYLLKQGCFHEEEEFHYCLLDVNDEIEDELENLQKANFVESIRRLDHTIYEKQVTIDYIDHLKDGETFEYFIAYLFKKKGYNTSVTKNPDQGVDVILEADGVRFGIQTKWYKEKSVGNDAVQEITAGLKKYKLTSGFVITNNYFTKSAEELAEANNIILWGRDELIKELKKTKIYDEEFKKYLKVNKK